MYKNAWVFYVIYMSRHLNVFFSVKFFANIRRFSSDWLDKCLNGRFEFISAAIFHMNGFFNNFKKGKKGQILMNFEVKKPEIFMNFDGILKILGEKAVRKGCIG